MNLRKIANSATQAINQNTSASLRVFSGLATNPDGSRVPTYLAPVTIQAQRQALTADELKQVDGLNLSGQKYGFYLEGSILGVLRADNRGGDLLTMPNGNIFLIVQVLEQWHNIDGPEWCKVVGVRQIS